MHSRREEFEHFIETIVRDHLMDAELLGVLNKGFSGGVEVMFSCE